MLAHVGVMLAQGGSKLAPRWLQITLCGLKLAPRCSKWPPNASQVPQDEPKMMSQNGLKMASKSICFSFMVIFHDIKKMMKNDMFSKESCSSEALKVSNVVNFRNTI